MAKQFTKIGKGGEGKYYYKDPEMTILHREDGPAYQEPFNYKEWWLNGRIHHLDGPAIEYPNGIKKWYINGVFMFEISSKTGKIVKRMR